MKKRIQLPRKTNEKNQLESHLRSFINNEIFDKNTITRLVTLQYFLREMKLFPTCEGKKTVGVVTAMECIFHDDFLYPEDKNHK